MLPLSTDSFTGRVGVLPSSSSTRLPVVLASGGILATTPRGTERHTAGVIQFLSVPSIPPPQGSGAIGERCWNTARHPDHSLPPTWPNEGSAPAPYRFACAVVGPVAHQQL